MADYEFTGTIDEFAQKMGDKSFNDMPFNEIDGAILSKLAYVEWEKCGFDGNEAIDKSEITMENAIVNYYGGREKFDELKDPNNYKNLSKTDKLLVSVATKNRYKDMKLSDYQYKTHTYEVLKNDPDRKGDLYEVQEQFSAITFQYKDENGKTQYFVSFRGTDGTYEGWEEDCDMFHDGMTEAQRDAVEYLKNFSRRNDKDAGYRLGGHSKGGNLAMYAYLFIDEKFKQNIEKMYNYDGPGFTKNTFYEDKDGNRVYLTQIEDTYNELLRLLDGSSICPFDSIVGQLLDEVPFTFIATNEGLFLDHNLETWITYVDKDGKAGFISKPQSSFSKYIDHLTDDLTHNLPKPIREKFMKMLWKFVYSRMGENNSDLLGESLKDENLFTILSFIIDRSVNGEISPEERLSLTDRFSFYIAVLDVLYEIRKLDDEEAKILFEFLIGKLFSYVCMNFPEIIDNIKDYFKSYGIHVIEDLINFAKNHDMQVLLGLLFGVISFIPSSFYNKIGEFVDNFIDVVFTLLVGVVAIIGITIAGITELIIALITVINAIKIAYNFIKQKVIEFVDWTVMTAEKIAEKIAEFAEAVKLEVINQLNKAIQNVGIFINKVSEAGYLAVEISSEAIRFCLKSLSKAIQVMMSITNPFYALIRLATGCRQQVVTIDMPRLQAAVNTMNVLAGRVGRVDSGLQGLYSQLCSINAREGEEDDDGNSIFESIVNFYHLSRANICVDQGDIIRRKSDAITSLYDGYEDAERFAMNLIGG